MKILTALLALCVLVTLMACGQKEVEVTREVEVTPVFDAEAEKAAVVAVSVGLDDAIAIADREAILAAYHEDITGFEGFLNLTNSWTRQDIGPDWGTEPVSAWWDDYEVLVSPGLAVIKGDRIVDSPAEGPIHIFSTAVFAKEDGEWKLIHSHRSYAGE